MSHVSISRPSGTTELASSGGGGLTVAQPLTITMPFDIRVATIKVGGFTGAASIAPIMTPTLNVGGLTTSQTIGPTTTGQLQVNP